LEQNRIRAAASAALGINQPSPGPAAEPVTLPPPPVGLYHYTTVTIGVLSVGKPYEPDHDFLGKVVETIREVGMPVGGTAFFEDMTQAMSRDQVLEVLGDEEYLQLLEARAVEGGDIKAETVAAAREAEREQEQSPAPPAPAMAPKRFVVIQEGGSSAELYAYGFGVREAAERFRIVCSRDSYRTSEVMELPEGVDANPDLLRTLEEVWAAKGNLAYADVPDGFDTNV
jgi:hypothetical protein